jgi:exopolyphosphatase/guanosine-5'-triphosphate,3'-diphosphate pyrophosphatase
MSAAAQRSSSSGTRLLGPAWVRSVDLGSLRLTAALLPGDPPPVAEIESARAVVQSGLADLDPPHPELALATGGSARAVARVVGHEYGADDLERVVALLAARPATESAKALGLRADRAHTLLAGAMILAQVSRLIGVPFAPSRGGIREGAALRLAARRVAA